VSRPLGDWPITSITPDDVERFKEVRVVEHTKARTERLAGARARLGNTITELRAKARLTKKETQSSGG